MINQKSEVDKQISCPACANVHQVLKNENSTLQKLFDLTEKQSDQQKEVIKELKEEVKESRAEAREYRAEAKE